MDALVVHAPGRVNLVGEHTDYSGGLVLPVALTEGITFEGRAGGDAIVLSSAGHGSVRVPADGSHVPPSGWGRYVAAVAVELDALGRPTVGLDGRLSSDLPAGSGLSSSAALEVAVGLALCEAAAFAVAPLELAAACQRAEQRAVGVPCGILDQAASLLGRAGHAVLLECRTLAHRHVPLPAGIAIVVLDSGVTRQLETSGYGQRRAELEDGLAVLDGRHPLDVALDDAMAAADEAGLADVPRRRLRHVVTENERVRAVVAALGRGDLAAVASAFSASHASLRDDFEVTVAETDLLTRLALDAGAIAARMTGGGFGGAIVALADAERAPALAAAVRDRYRAATRREATAIVTTAGPGARAVKVSDAGC